LAVAICMAGVGKKKGGQTAKQLEVVTTIHGVLLRQKLGIWLGPTTPAHGDYLQHLAALWRPLRSARFGNDKAKFNLGGEDPRCAH